MRADDGYGRRTCVNLSTSLVERSPVRPHLRRCLVAFAALVALAASACTGTSDDERPVALPTKVLIAAGEDPWPDEGEGTTSTHFVFPLNFNVYEPLVTLGPDFSLQPGLAERWEPLDGGNAGWRFHLRRGVTFQDGTPFTADDVLWTWDRQAEARKLTSVLNTLGPGSVRQRDDYTVDFVPAVPNLRLPEQLAHPHGAILPRGRDFDSNPPVGSGPYRVASYQPGESAIFERYEGYWGEAPGIPRLEVRFLADPKARAEALTKGDVDVALDVAPDDAATLAKDRRFTLARSEAGRNQLLYVNRQGQAPFDLGADPLVRQAISLAVDRAAYAREVFGAEAEPGRWMAPASILGEAKDLVAPPPSDPERARRLLDEAGWVPGEDGVRARNGRRLGLTMIGWAEVTPRAYEILSGQLRTVGIELNVQSVSDQSTFRSIYGTSQFDLDLEVPNQNDGNPALLPVARMYSKNPGTGRFAPGGEFDAKAEAALAAKDPEDLRRAAAEMMQILVNDTHIVIPLAGVPRTYAMKRTFDLPTPHPSQANQRWDDLVPVRR